MGNKSKTSGNVPVFVISGFDAVEWLAEHGVRGLLVVHLFHLFNNNILCNGHFTIFFHSKTDMV
jgi:hypothetical protein